MHGGEGVVLGCMELQYSLYGISPLGQGPLTCFLQCAAHSLGTCLCDAVCDLVCEPVRDPVCGPRQLTDRTRADVQGGILTEYEGKPKLVEAVQVPPEHLHEFHLLKKFNLFNTNNLWVSLRAVQVRAGAIGTTCVAPADCPWRVSERSWTVRLGLLLALLQSRAA